MGPALPRRNPEGVFERTSGRTKPKERSNRCWLHLDPSEASVSKGKGARSGLLFPVAMWFIQIRWGSCPDMENRIALISLSGLPEFKGRMRAPAQRERPP